MKTVAFWKYWLFVILPIYILDQITKMWTVKHFSLWDKEMGRQIEIIPNFFYWVRVHNQGIAFGIGNGTSWAPVLFLIVPIIAMILLRYFWKQGVFATPLSIIALALLLCGIFGNLTDRLVQGFLLPTHQDASFLERLSQGYVVDFIAIKLPYFEKIMPSSYGWWPAFNVADSCICIAATILFFSSLMEHKEPNKIPS